MEEDRPNAPVGDEGLRGIGRPLGLPWAPQLSLSSPGPSLPPSSPASSVVARSRSPRRISQARGSFVVDSGVGAVCGMAAKSSPTGLTTRTRLQASLAEPPPAVMARRWRIRGGGVVVAPLHVVVALFFRCTPNVMRTQ